MLNVLAGVAVIDELLSADNFNVAGHLCTVLQSAGGKEQLLQQVVQEETQKVTALRTVHDLAARLAAKLKTSPNDPTANFAVGSYLCFAKDRWESGLPLLERAGIPAIAAAASKEIAAHADGSQRLAVADAWWNASQKQTGLAAQAMRDRAVTWYEKAVNSGEVTGLDRIRVQKRIADADQGPGLEGSGR